MSLLKRKNWYTLRALDYLEMKRRRYKEGRSMHNGVTGIEVVWQIELTFVIWLLKHTYVRGYIGKHHNTWTMYAATANYQAISHL